METILVANCQDHVEIQRRISEGETIATAAAAVAMLDRVHSAVHGSDRRHDANRPSALSAAAVSGGSSGTLARIGRR